MNRPPKRPAPPRRSRVLPARLPARGERDFPALVLLGLFVLAPVFLVACRDPDRAILAALSEPERARFERGRQIALPCWTCHDLAGTVDKVGPSLLGVFGRRSGMAPDQAGSDAMRAASIVWDERSLAAFLMDPQGYVPGNRMVSPGVRDADGLADLLFYLQRVTKPGARGDDRVALNRPRIVAGTESTWIARSCCATSRSSRPSTPASSTD